MNNREMKWRRISAKALIGSLICTAAAAVLSLSTAHAQDDRFDLSGMEITVGTAQAQVLNVGVIRMMNMLEDWGAEIDRVELPNISGLEAIVAERIDMAAKSSDEVVLGNYRGVHLVSFGAPISTMHYAVVSSPGVDTIADLDGKSIGTSGPGGFNGMLFRYLLNREGLVPEEDVSVVPIGGSSERAAALMAGQVQAAIVYIDNWIAMREEGANAQLLGYVADLVPGLSSRAIFAPRSFLDDNPEFAKAVACANLETNAWINSDKEGFVKFTLDNVRGASEDAVSAFYDVAMEIDMFPTDPGAVLNASGYEKLQDVMYEGGEIDERVEISRMLDQQYLDAAAEMGCGR